jgi:D-alanyl-D-alanine carboxypeptidase (penicillin-binding protein 5/6)
MQANARRLGAFDTVVRNPSGLDAPGQLSSAYDLALVARAAMALPELRAVVATKHAQFPGKKLPGKARKSYQISNHNTLLFNYDGTLGVKNGYTVAARWTAIAAATRAGHTYVLTALHRGESSWRPEAAMFDWAFRYGSQARPVGTLVTPDEVAAQQAAASAATASAAPVAAANSTVALSRNASSRSGTLGYLATAAAAVAVFVVVLLALSARARRRQLHVARRARYERQTVR